MKECIPVFHINTVDNINKCHKFINEVIPNNTVTLNNSKIIVESDNIIMEVMPFENFFLLGKRFDKVVITKEAVIQSNLCLWDKLLQISNKVEII